jgi:hypothetical protein
VRFAPLSAPEFRSIWSPDCTPARSGVHGTAGKVASATRSTGWPSAVRDLGGAGSGDASGDWARQVTSDIARYLHAETIDDYLRLRAGELARSPHLGWGPAPAAPVAPPPVIAADEPAAESAGDRRDVFISYAGEDKAGVARPLAAELRQLGLSVWLDEDELVVGDSLSESIEWGLAHSERGIVVLSRSFFAKPWPRRELRGLVAREMSEDRHLILPVWHGIDHRYLAEVSPTLADLLAADTAAGIPAVAQRLVEALGRGARPAARARRDRRSRWRRSSHRMTPRSRLRRSCASSSSGAGRRGRDRHAGAAARRAARVRARRRRPLRGARRRARHA